MTEPGTIEIREVAAPDDIQHNEVKIQIKKIGVCGSDIHVFHGKHPFTQYPVIQGHEYSGRVVEVGENVKLVKPGDKVTARPQRVCGKCGPCERGDYNICDSLKVEGFQAPGTAQDFFIVPENRTIRLPDTMSYEEGAMVEPVAVAVHATARAGSLKGKNVVVTGSGPIGNLVAQLAIVRGASKVLITDQSDFRLGKAVACGIASTSNATSESLSDACNRVFGKENFDIAFECSGAEAALDQIIQTVNKGGTIVIVAVYGSRPRVDMAVVGDRELTMVGTLMYKQEDYLEAVRIIENKEVKILPMITRHFDFNQYQEAYEYIDRQGDKSLKVMIDL